MFSLNPSEEPFAPVPSFAPARKPKPISSATEIDATLILHRTRADNTTSDAARDAIFREMLADGRAESSSIMDSLRKALSSESAAENDLQSARGERARLETLQSQWEDMAAKLEEMKTIVDIAVLEVGAVRNAPEYYREQIFKKIGKMDAPYSAAFMASKAAEAAASLPFMEAAEKALIEAYWIQVQEAREFGVKHGVPKHALASLPAREATS